ncbi:hypothetical protein D3C81_1952280 [compost metagenome]
MTVLIIGDQMNDLAGHARRKPQLEAGVIGIVRAEVELTRRDDAGHGVEQPNEVKGEVRAMTPGEGFDEAQSSNGHGTG